MVEMSETANILNNATSKSLVLMDEIGRGTSTFDGLSLAWACAVELAANIQAMTLFATHYFELTILPEHFEKSANIHLTATEHNDNIIFMHNIQEGPANQSYGLQVAKLAGIPQHVLISAKNKLLELEQTEFEQQGLFNQQAPQQNELPLEPVQHSIIEEYLATINPDEVSAKQALDILYELKEKLSLI